MATGRRRRVLQILAVCVLALDGGTSKCSSLENIKYEYKAGQEPPQWTKKFLDVEQSRWVQHTFEDLPSPKRPRFYVDLAANHPLFESNTYRLEQIGWRGICIDAQPACRARLQLQSCHIQQDGLCYMLRCARTVFW